MSNKTIEKCNAVKYKLSNGNWLFTIWGNFVHVESYSVAKVKIMTSNPFNHRIVRLREQSND